MCVIRYCFSSFWFNIAYYRLHRSFYIYKFPSLNPDGTEFMFYSPYFLKIIENPLITIMLFKRDPFKCVSHVFLVFYNCQLYRKPNTLINESNNHIRVIQITSGKFEILGRSVDYLFFFSSFFLSSFL